MPHIVVSIYDLRRQSERHLPNIGPFVHILMSVKELKAEK